MSSLPPDYIAIIKRRRKEIDTIVEDALNRKPKTHAEVEPWLREIVSHAFDRGENHGYKIGTTDEFKKPADDGS